MRKPFVYLALALARSLLLCGCGAASDTGNVTTSPWPDVTEPVLPMPSAMVSATPMPDRITDSGTETPVGSAMPEMSSASPNPTSTTR